MFITDFAIKVNMDRAQEGTPCMVGRHGVLLQAYGTKTCEPK